MLNPEDLFSKPALFLRENLLKIELIALSLGVLGYYLFRFGFEPGEFILSICLSGLGTIYYLTAFRPIPYKNKFEEFCVKLTSWTFSVVIIGVLFTLLHWVGGKVIIRVGLISTVIVFCLAILNATILKKENLFEKQDIYRLSIAFAIVLSFSFSTFNKPNSGEREKEEMEMEEHSRQSSPDALP